MKPAIVVLAAGMGSRYGGVKQIDPVGPSGEIILDYSLYDAHKKGFEKVVFVIRKDIEEAFRERIGNRLESRFDVRYVFQQMPEHRKKPWGTSHAVLTAASELNEPFGVINADDYYGPNGYGTLYDFLSAPMSPNDHCIIAFILRNTLSEHGGVSRGICSTDPDGWLTAVRELTGIVRDGNGAVQNNPDGTEENLSGDELISMNMWGFRPSFLELLAGGFERFVQQNAQDQKAEFYLPTAVDEIIRSGEGRVKVLESHDSWFGVTYPQDKALVVEKVAELISQGAYPSNLWAD